MPLRKATADVVSERRPRRAQHFIRGPSPRVSQFQEKAEVYPKLFKTLQRFYRSCLLEHVPAHFHTDPANLGPDLELGNRAILMDQVVAHFTAEQPLKVLLRAVIGNTGFPPRRSLLG